MITWPYTLTAGHSANPADGACAMDAVNWLAHGKHGDVPVCACPTISSFVRQGNDAMPEDVRQRLLPYLHRIAGSRSLDHEAARVHVLWLAAVRVFTPLGLDGAGLHGMADRLRTLPDDVPASVANTAAKAALRSGLKATEVARIAWLKSGAPSPSERDAFRIWRAADGAATAAAAAVWAIESAMSAAKAFELGDIATREEISEVRSSSARGSAKSARAVAEIADVSDATEGRQAAWDPYFATLDAALSAGPQGEPWSADVLHMADDRYRAAGGLVTGEARS